METPEAFHIGRMGWQLFGTLTFKSERLPERVRLAMWFAFLRQTGKRLSAKFPRLLWCLRQEQGEIGGRRHFHCLLAGLPPAQLCPSLNFELMALWERLGGGWARVMRYRDDLDGVGYVLKGLGYASQSEQNYEMRKFGSESLPPHSVELGLAQAASSKPGTPPHSGATGHSVTERPSGTTLGNRSVVTL